MEFLAIMGKGTCQDKGCSNNFSTEYECRNKTVSLLDGLMAEIIQGVHKQ